VPELPTFRMLVTGSRSWKDPRPIEQAIYDMAMEAAQLGKDLVVVHGACRGADRLAQSIVRRQRAHGWRHIHEEPHPADWNAACIERCRPGHRRPRTNGTDYCPAEGRYRNELMVGLGADVAFAFIKDQSPGATHCAEFAEAAGICTTRIIWEKL
jgi:YspA, cpYpsA-related SLOG family